MFIKETVAISTAIGFVLLLAPSRAQETKCTELPARNQSAYIGWPVIIDTNVVYQDEFVFHYLYGGSTWPTTMTFKGSDKPFYNFTDDYDNEYSGLPYDYYSDYGSKGSKGEIPNVTTATPTEIEVKAQDLNGGSCVAQTVILQPTQLPDLTCKYASNNTEIIMKSSMGEGDMTVLGCLVYDDDEPGIDIDKYNVTWYYNCDTKLPPDITVSHNKLHFHADHKKHPGMYSCSIKHNEQERFLVAIHFCIKPYTQSNVYIICPKKITVYKGDAVNITCDVSVPRQHRNIFRFLHVVKFDPILYNGSRDLLHDNLACTSLFGRNRSFAEQDERASCIFYSVTLPESSGLKCFDYIPTRLEWENAMDAKTNLRVSYELKKCTTRDAVLMRSLVYRPMTNDYGSCQTAIEVMKRPDRTALIIGAVGFFFIILIVILCCRFRMQIRCWWRQTSCIKYKNGVMSKELNKISPQENTPPPSD